MELLERPSRCTNAAIEVAGGGPSSSGDGSEKNGRSDMRVCRGTKLALAVCTIGIVVGVAGCGGGDGDPPPFVLNIIDCDFTTFANQGVVCVQFIPTGFPFGQFDVLPQFQ